MANICSYLMQVQGSEKNVKEFITIITANYSFEDTDPIHLHKVDVDSVDCSYDINGNYTATICGSCAWSVKCCMVDYAYEKNKNDHTMNTLTHLQRESERLDLFIEVYSEEVGLEFQEHYKFYNGRELEADCIYYSEFLLEDYETYADADNEIKLVATEEQFNDAKADDDWLRVGGYGDWEFDDITNYQNRIA